MATATLEQTCTNEVGGKTKIVAVITEATDIPVELFVFTVEVLAADDKYDHVATPYDVGAYPTVRDANKAFWRKDTITLDFADVDSGIAAKASLKARMLLTVQEYAKSQDSFVGVVTDVLDSEA